MRWEEYRIAYSLEYWLAPNQWLKSPIYGNNLLSDISKTLISEGIFIIAGILFILNRDYLHQNSTRIDKMNEKTT